MKIPSGAILTSAVMLALLFLPFHWEPAEGQLLEVLSLDFEDDNGGMRHGGNMDLWEWGVPGPGSQENPGPVQAGGGDKVWGCPLNGTYNNGTHAYLLSPELDTSYFKNLEISFLYWMDLTLMEYEDLESGEILGMDQCTLQVSIDARDWIDVRAYNGSRTAGWEEDTLMLGSELGDSLVFRFLLVDAPDGYNDNGFMVDNIEVSGEQKPATMISLGSDAYIPPVVAGGESARITFQVLDEGMTVPEDTYVTVYIESAEQTMDFYERSVITSGSSGRISMDWFPSSSGPFRGWINLTVGGEYQEGRSFNMRSFSPIYYDDSSLGTSHMTIQNGIAEGEWITMDPTLAGFSMSGGKVFWYGSENGGPDGSAGFKGPTWAYMETDWIDLAYYTDSFLYIYHKYSFLGPKGSSGGVVEALTEDGVWTVLEPLGFTYGSLKEDISGPLAGSDAIVGAEDWGVDGFELSPFIGDRTRIRFSVVANEDGYGEGWFLDGIMVSGEGYDPFDTEPPAPVEGLSAEVVDEGAVSLYWDPSNARDFAFYKIYLEEFEFEDVTGLVPHMTIGDPDEDSTVITDLVTTGTYWVAVTAVDMTGNEENGVTTVSFKPTFLDDNRPPTADIKIIGGSFARSVGEDIKLDATGSRDPDGDPLTYFWTMPDGSTFRGATVTWRAEKPGEDLAILLTVKDSNGLSDSESVTIDVIDNDVDIYENADLWSFVLVAILIVLIILIMVFIATVLRSSARKRLERRLRKIGMDPESFLLSREKRKKHFKSSLVIDRQQSPKVHDLIQVKRDEEGEERVEILPEWKEPETEMTVKRAQPRSEGQDRYLKVVIECPFCSGVFKQKVPVSAIKKHQTFTVRCPDCGRSGDITP
ncbi:MAG: PKD domain-containing protein [Thermoplasmatota archaeon]